MKKQLLGKCLATNTKQTNPWSPKPSQFITEPTRLSALPPIHRTMVWCSWNFFFPPLGVLVLLLFPIIGPQPIFLNYNNTNAEVSRMSMASGDCTCPEGQANHGMHTNRCQINTLKQSHPKIQTIISFDT